MNVYAYRHICVCISIYVYVYAYRYMCMRIDLELAVLHLLSGGAMRSRLAKHVIAGIALCFSATHVVNLWRFQ